MDQKNLLYIAIGALLLWLLFFRRPSTASAGVPLVPTGAGATPYSGYPPGVVPPGAGGIGSYGGAPQPIYQASSGDNTGAIIGGVGQLIGGIGSATGSVLTGLGNSGLLGGSSSGSSGDSYDFGN